MGYSNCFVGQNWLTDFTKKALAKAKSLNFFERKIANTRPLNGTVITAKTHTLATWGNVSNDQAWANGTFSYVAPVTGWYWLYAAGVTSSGQTCAYYITYWGVQSRNAIYNAVRDGSTNAIWVPKGGTISYAGRMSKTIYLRYVAAYEY